MENKNLEQLIKILEKFVNNEINKEELLQNLNLIKKDESLLKEELIKQILEELENSIDEITRKEIKQRILMLKTY